MKESRKQFTFYRSFWETVNKCPPEVRGVLYDAIANYALNRETPHLEGLADIVWTQIKASLDSQWTKYNNGCKGGCPPGTKKPSMVGNQNAAKVVSKDEVNTSDVALTDVSNKVTSKPTQHYEQPSRFRKNDSRTRRDSEIAAIIDASYCR